MVTLQAYLWSHYNLAILLFFVISTRVKTYLLGKSVAVLFNTPQFISYNDKGADIKLPVCTFNTLYTSYTLYTLYTCLQNLVYRSPTIRMLLSKALYTLYTLYTCLQNLVYRSPTIRMLLSKALYTLYTHYTLYTC